MNQFMSGEELEQAEMEQQAKENEMLSQYDRSLYCEDPARIAEMVKNIFMTAQNMDPENMFFEADENYIKWSLQSLSANPAMFIVVEGLLSHRMKAGLLVEVYENENMAPFKVLPSGTPILKNTAFLGKIRDMKQVEDIKENVIRMAGIPIDDESENVAVFAEPLNPMIPNMEGLCIALINLTDQQMNNLRKASKVKKVTDRVQKISDNFNTSTYGVMKMGLEGVATPAICMAGKSAGLVAGTLGVATFKGTAGAIAEITDQIAKADVRNCREVKEIKHNVSKIMQQFGRGNKGDSFSFEF